MIDHDRLVRSLDNDRFARLVRSLAGPAPGASEAANLERLAGSWALVLSSLYGQPRRHYHTVDHIKGMLTRFDIVRDLDAAAGFELEIETAIWFHDAIYVPGSPDNERESARLAIAFLAALEVPEPFRNRVGRAILATTHQQIEGMEPAMAVLLDLDLASLAAPWDDFKRNNANIRKEMSHISDEQFRWGQVAFLSGLMRRSAIFRVDGNLEQPARRNIERYLADLVADRL